MLQLNMQVQIFWNVFWSHRPNHFEILLNCSKLSDGILLPPRIRIEFRQRARVPLSLFHALKTQLVHFAEPPRPRFLITRSSPNCKTATRCSQPTNKPSANSLPGSLPIIRFWLDAPSSFPIMTDAIVPDFHEGAESDTCRRPRRTWIPWRRGQMCGASENEG